VNSRVAESLDGSAPRSAEGLGVHLRQLLGLEIELALAEARAILVRATIVAALGAVAVTALPAGLTVLLAAALAPAFSTPWQHLAAAGGAMLSVSCATILWSTWYLRRLRLPHDALNSIREHGRWLATELRSRPISRLFGH
jgi:hypothetical protein